VRGNETVALLERLLESERKRSDRLLELLLLPPMPITVSPAERPDIEPTSAPEYRWSQIQPEDEAREDVLSQMASGQIDRVEAEAILEHLGFANAEVDDIHQ